MSLRSKQLAQLRKLTNIRDLSLMMELEFLLINTGTIDRYNTTYGSVRFMNKGERLFKPKLDLTKSEWYKKIALSKLKIIIAKLALRIEGFLDKKGDYASINTNCIHSPKGELTLDYLVGIMNSNLLSFVYSELFFRFTYEWRIFSISITSN